MSKQSKRILIIDDDITTYAENMDYMFHDCGVEVEVQHVRFSDEAIGVLERWFKNGDKPNIITADDNRVGHGELAYDVLTEVLERCEAQGEGFLPEKFFVHSKSRVTPVDLKWGEAGRLNTEELICIGDWGNPERYEWGYFRNTIWDYTTLRKYCNESWQTNFILKEDSYKFKQNPETKFEPYQIQEFFCC